MLSRGCIQKGFLPSLPEEPCGEENHWESEKANPDRPLLPRVCLTAGGRESLELDLSLEFENSLDFVNKNGRKIRGHHLEGRG